MQLNNCYNWLNTHMNVCAHIYIYMYSHIYLCVSISLYVWVCMVCMYIYISIYILYILTYMYVCIYSSMYGIYTITDSLYSFTDFYHDPYTPTTIWFRSQKEIWVSCGREDSSFQVPIDLIKSPLIQKIFPFKQFDPVDPHSLLKMNHSLFVWMVLFYYLLLFALEMFLCIQLDSKDSIHLLPIYSFYGK